MAAEAPKPQTKNKTNSDMDVISHSHLGGLPPELFDKILLEINTIRDLAQFIPTARFVYQRFSVQRRAVLFRVLQNELGPVLADARFLFVFPYSDPTDQARHVERLSVMANIYHRMLRDGAKDGIAPLQGDATPPLEELNGLCRTLHHINFIADIYTTTRLQSFALRGGGGTPATAPLSPPERQRLLRSLYRRQILSNARATSPHRPRCDWTQDDVAAISDPSTHRGRGPLGLFGALAPWEWQQIDHADVFTAHLCLALAQPHHWPSASPSPPPPPVSSGHFDDLLAHLHRLVPFLRTHREVAERAVRVVAGEDAELPCSAPRRQNEYLDACLLAPLRAGWQMDCSAGFSRAVVGRGVLPYVGDGVELAPYGWLDALSGRYVAWFGEALSRFPWRRRGNGQLVGPPLELVRLLAFWRHAGFCLWDRERVEALKGLGVMGGQLETGWLVKHWE